MLRIELVGDRELLARFDSLPADVRRALVIKITSLTLQLEAKVKQKLSDDVLHVRTGELRASIQHDVKDEGSSITGTVFSNAASPARKYARIHEYGGIIKHPGGTAYLYLQKAGGVRFISNLVAEKLNARFKKGDLPRTRPHDIPMPQRSYLRSALAEMKNTIVRGIMETARILLSKG